MADLCTTPVVLSPSFFVMSGVDPSPTPPSSTAVLTAVACSVGTQYGVKFLVDVLSNHDGAGVWIAFGLLGLVDRRR